MNTHNTCRLPILISTLVALEGLAAGEDGRGRALRTRLIDGMVVAESVPSAALALQTAGQDGGLWMLVNPQ